MKKIPTLFHRVFENGRIAEILPQVTAGMEWVLESQGIATVKLDGACCAIINGEFYKRYDAKGNKKPPTGAIPCCEPDPITGHHPHWVKVDPLNPADKWFIEAYNNTSKEILTDGTFEAIGTHFQGNPYLLTQDVLKRHGTNIIEVERTFEGIGRYLASHYIEGIVFWRDGEPMCKIKRSDFGLVWDRNISKRCK